MMVDEIGGTLNNARMTSNAKVALDALPSALSFLKVSNIFGIHFFLLRVQSD